MNNGTAPRRFRLRAPLTAADEGRVRRSVARPTRWGNPFDLREHGRAWAVEQHRTWIYAPEQAKYRDEVRAALAGSDLGCFCSLDQPCHADTLLKIANSPADAGDMFGRALAAG